MRVRVVAFGPLTDIFAEQDLDLALPARASEIETHLVAAIPELSAHRFSLAVDDALVGPDDRVESAREISLLPPFAGG